MNSIAIKINSFKTQNEILINGQPVAMNSEFMNYYSKPLVNVVDKLFETAEIEFNDYFAVEAYGNKFEQALISLIAKKFDLCESVALCDPNVNIGMASRLSLIEPYANLPLTIGLQLCTDNISVALPSIDSLEFVHQPDNRIIVSDDMDFIRSQMDEHNRVAFLVGGESQKHGKSYIIGCTTADVNELIQDYIASRFVNPLIHKIVQSLDDASSEGNLADCTEPYYYIASELQLNAGESCSLPLCSYPKDDNNSQLRVLVKGDAVEADGLIIKGINNGTAIVEIFNNSPIPCATTKVKVISHNLIKEIELSLDAPSLTLRTGTSYDISINLYPEEAEDKGTLKIDVSDKRIAHIENGKLFVDAPGVFELTAATAQVATKLTLTAKNKIEKIKLSNAPKKIYIGDVFEINATVSPADLYNGTYRWMTSNKEVAVVGKDNNGRELVKIKGVGSATISCIAEDDETILDTMEINAESTFNKHGHSQTFLFIGVIATIVAWFISFGGIASTGYWIAFGVSMISLIISLIRKEGVGKTIFFMLLVVASVVFLLI